MEDGGWRMEDGGWRTEDGGWRMEDGGWRMECQFQSGDQVRVRRLAVLETKDALLLNDSTINVDGILDRGICLPIVSSGDDTRQMDNQGSGNATGGTFPEVARSMVDGVVINAGN